jgi:hypothetical protein
MRFDFSGPAQIAIDTATPRGTAAFLRDVLAIFERSPGNARLTGVITRPESRA